MILGLWFLFLALQISLGLQARVAASSADIRLHGPLSHVLHPVPVLAHASLTNRATRSKQTNHVVGWTPGRKSSSSRQHHRSPAREFSASKFRPSRNAQGLVMSAATRNDSADVNDPFSWLASDSYLTNNSSKVSNPYSWFGSDLELPSSDPYAAPTAQRVSPSHLTSKDYYAEGQNSAALNGAMKGYAFDPPKSASKMMEIGSWDSYIMGDLAVGALAAHTTPAFQQYNLLLRNGNLSSLHKYREFTSNLLKGLGTLPPYHGTVYRGVFHNQEKSARIPAYAIGMEVDCDDFTSTSVDRVVANRPWQGTGLLRTIWEIELRGDEARLVEEFSTRPDEREVLLPPGAKLKVMSVVQEPGGERIVMEEVLPSEPDGLLPQEEFYKGRLSMRQAARNGLLDIAKTLKAISEKSVNECDAEGQAPLHYAAAYGHVQMIEFLVASKADVDKKSKIGETPLQSAQSHDKPSAVVALLKASW